MKQSSILPENIGRGKCFMQEIVLCFIAINPPGQSEHQTRNYWFIVMCAIMKLIKLRVSLHNIVCAKVHRHLNRLSYSK